MSETLATALLKALKDRGADRVFGIPGDFVLPFFRAISETDILPLHTLSHEPSVGYAADAASRIGSSLGVAAVTYGAGALNMVNAVAQAYAEKSPLVVISGAPGAQEGVLGLGLHHQVKRLNSQFEVFRELTCAQCTLDDPAIAHQEIARVLDTAISLSRPVYIEFPRDLVDMPCASVPPMHLPPPDLDSARACAREIIGKLRAAASPAILVGVEARRYDLEDRIAELCRTLCIPVATSFMGRGLFAAEELPLLGTYLGSAGDPEVAEAVEGADCLLMLGVIVCDTNFGVSGREIDMRASIRALDRTVVFAHHIYPDVTLEALIDALTEIAEPIGAAKSASGASYAVGLPDDAMRLAPSHIAIGINDLFETHGPMPIAADVGDCLFIGLEVADTELVAPGYYASMGTGVPAGLAINAVTGRRPIVLVGDGAFQMTGWELGNCQRYGWSPIVIVLNNQGWGMLRTFAAADAYTDLADFHYADLAQSLGGKGERVETCSELAEALKRAVEEEGGFYLIEAMLPRGSTSDALQRFTQAIRRISALANE